MKITKIIANILSGLDSLFTCDDERGQAQALIQSELNKYEAELTARHKADMNSDSWLSKNIRPMSLIFILFLYTVFSVFSGNIGEFKIESSYVELLGQWGMFIMSFYFGGRSIEKVASIIDVKKIIGNGKK